MFYRKPRFDYFSPPKNWRIPVIVTTGIFTGLILFVLYAGNATSYLSENPETCINCHVMYTQYATWQHSSHARVANCNDCHVPHNNVFSKFFFKAKDGLRHSTIFTLRLEPQVIRIKEAGIRVVQANCERCHEGLLSFHETMEYVWRGKNGEDEENERLCWDCHRETPHGRVNSLSSVPNARVPKLNPIIPEWIMKLTGNKK
jgi:cytochrome c nitrite reductase small subunit